MHLKIQFRKETCFYVTPRTSGLGVGSRESGRRAARPASLVPRQSGHRLSLRSLAMAGRTKPGQRGMEP